MRHRLCRNSARLSNKRDTTSRSAPNFAWKTLSCPEIPTLGLRSTVSGTHSGPTSDAQRCPHVAVPFAELAFIHLDLLSDWFDLHGKRDCRKITIFQPPNHSLPPTRLADFLVAYPPLEPYQGDRHLCRRLAGRQNSPVRPL
ncbi:MAG: hypothetical protein RIR18_1728 [Pseudomonadota bacterium]